jgi:hypothetical protein
MKTQKLLVIVASVCLMAFLISGSAYAQARPIIANYLAEFQENSGETLRDLDEVSDDLRECYRDFDDCSSGRSQGLVQCLGDFVPCVSRESRDKDQTCTSFLREFRGDYRRASRDARRAGVEENFQNNAAVQGTVAVALGISSLCY